MISRDQARQLGLSDRAIAHRVESGSWRRLGSGVFVAARTPPTRRQMQVAALLRTGPQAALDDVDACHAAGLVATPLVAHRVFVVAPIDSAARTRGFVVVRRTRRPFVSFHAGAIRFVEPAVALVAMSRRVRSQRAVLAAFSEAVQRRVVRLDNLAAAHSSGPPRHAGPAARALADLGAGIRSAPEGDFRTLAQASSLLPPLLYNRRLRLPGGRVVVPDALAPDARLVHETNGRAPHAREDLFESMQERHDAMTAAGLIVLHNSPRRIRTAATSVIEEFERCYRDNAGRGLPPGVELLPD